MLRLYGSTLLVWTDSQSLLQALAKGPLLTEEDHEDELWAPFLTLVLLGFGRTGFMARDRLGKRGWTTCGAGAWGRGLNLLQ